MAALIGQQLCMHLCARPPLFSWVQLTSLLQMNLMKATETESCDNSTLASVHLSQLQSEESHELTGYMELEESVPTAPLVNLDLPLRYVFHHL